MGRKKTNAKKDEIKNKTIPMTPPRKRKKSLPSFTPNKREVTSYLERAGINVSWREDKYIDFKLKYEKYPKRKGDTWYKGKKYSDMIFDFGKKQKFSFHPNVICECCPFYAYMLFIQKRLLLELDDDIFGDGNKSFRFKQITYGKKVKLCRDNKTIWVLEPKISRNGIEISLLNKPFKLNCAFW